MPDATAQATALKTVNDVYKTDIASARKPEEKSIMAKKMIAAAETENDQAGRYILLKRASDSAVQAGDVKTAMVAAETLEALYNVDGLKLKAETLLSVARTSKRQEDEQFAADYAESVVDEAVTADQYELAKQVAEVALTSARRGNDPLLAREISDRIRQIGNIESAFEKTVAARESLKKEPSDPEANLELGRFLCLVKGDWIDGLPRLALGPDPALKNLAIADIAAPSTPNEQVGLADGWWNWGETQSGEFQDQARNRAAKWYREAAPMLTGLAKAKAMKRLEHITEFIGSFGPATRLAMQVAANQGWQRALECRKGDIVSIAADGLWCTATPARREYTMDAAGKPTQLNDDFIPRSPYGCLIGQIGTHRYVVGRWAKIRAVEDGVLELRINDKGLFDNDGELTVTIYTRQQKAP